MAGTKKSTKRLKQKVSRSVARAGGAASKGGVGVGGGGGVGKRRAKVSSGDVAKFLKQQRAAGATGAGRPKFVKKGGKGGKKGRSADDGNEKTNGGKGKGDDDADEEANPSDRTRLFEDMDADAFVDGGFMELAGVDDESDDSEDGGDDDEGDLDGDSDSDASQEESDDDSIDGQGARNAIEGEPRSLGSGSMHKMQLENLKKSDPEFYQYLEKQDDGLLAFDADDDDDDGDEDEKDQDNSGDEDDADMGVKATIISAEMVERWCEIAGSDKPTLGSAKNLLRAYRAACHHGDGGGEDGASAPDDSGAPVQLSGADTYNRVVTFCLKNMGGLLLRLLGEKPPDLATTKKSQGKDASKADGRASKKWRGMEPLFRTFTGNSLHLLLTMTDPTLIAFTLKSLRLSMKILVPFPSLSRKFLKAVLAVFGDSASEEPRSKFEAYLFLKQMAIDLADSCFERTLNGMYRTFASSAKFVNHASLPRVAFMAGCIADCFGVDQIKAYPIAFQHIRQMAIMLKSALTAKSAETVQTVYSWQFLNCADVWIRVLSAHAAEEDAPLRPLVYPLVQILVGVIKLVPSSRYTPLRLRCVKMLISFSKTTDVYVPISPLLLSVLSMSELKSPPTGGAGRHTDWLYTIRLPKSLLRTSTFHEQTVMEVVDLLTMHTAQYACHISFPELAYTTVVALKHFASASPVERFRKQVRALVAALEQNSAWVMQRRSNVDFAPKDLEDVDAFQKDCEKTNKSPLAKFAKEKVESRKRREAAARTQNESFTLKNNEANGKASRDPANDEESDSDSEDDDDSDDSRGGGRRSAAKEKHSQEDPAAKRKMVAMMRTGAGEETSFGDVDTEDVVGDLVLSDDDDDDENTDGNNDEAAFDFEGHITGGRLNQPRPRGKSAKRKASATGGTKKAARGGVDGRQNGSVRKKGKKGK